MKYLRIFAICLFALAVQSCTSFVSSSDKTALKMPETFLGAWGYSEGYFSLTVNPDGTMLFANRETGEPVEKIRYKIIHIYDENHVVMVYKDKTLYPVEEEWGSPSLLALFMYPPSKNRPFSDPSYHWSYSCLNHLTEDIWENPVSYADSLGDKDDIMERMCAKIPIWRHSSIVPVHSQ